MKARYEIHFEGRTIESYSLEELKRVGENLVCYFEIYSYYASVPFHSTSGNLKLKIQDIEEAKRLLERGYSMQTVSNKFHVIPNTLLRALREFQTV